MGVTQAARLRFEIAAKETVLPGGGYRTCGSYEGIGTLGEKRIHATVKNFLSPDPAFQEVPLPDIVPEAGKKVRHYVADVKIGNEIFEVQTGGFAPLRAKLDYYLRYTDCHVTVVHPMTAYRYLSYIDRKTGEMTKPRKTSQKETVQSIARELYWIMPYFGGGQISLRLLFIGVEEYKIRTGKTRRGREVTEKYDRVPIELTDDVTLSDPRDFAEWFLPGRDDLPAPFTAADYMKVTRIRGMAAYGILHFLTDLGVLRDAGKIGRAGAWSRADGY